MGCEAAPKTCGNVYQTYRMHRFYDCFAAERGINPLATRVCFRFVRRFIRQPAHPRAILAKMPAFSIDTAGNRREQRTRSHFRPAFGPGA